METNSEIQVAEQLTPAEAATFLGYKLSYVYKLISLKEIPHLKYGGRFVRFRKSDLQEWRDSRVVEIPSRAQMQAQAVAYCAKHPVR